jgi:hypothetical protein
VESRFTVDADAAPASERAREFRTGLAEKGLLTGDAQRCAAPTFASVGRAA